MNFGEITARSIIQKSGLSATSYSVNTFTGCTHACVYCYACFMRRLKDRAEPWGSYADAKINAAELFARDLKKLRAGGDVFFGSVTDVYQPLEKKNRLMRGILSHLNERREQASAESAAVRAGYFPGMEPEPAAPPLISFSILTKSDLVLRDLDLLTQLPEISVGFSIALLDERVRAILEPGAVSIARRLDALGTLHDSGVRTFVFINPTLPYLTPISEIMAAIRGKADSVFGESLNQRCGNLPTIFQAVERVDPALVTPFRRALDDPVWLAERKREFLEAARRNKIATDGFWDHSETTRGD